MNKPIRGTPEESLRRLVEEFSGLADARLAPVLELPESVRASGGLLVSVLGQDIGTGSLARLVRELHARLGADLFSLSASGWSELERAVRFPWLAEWPHRDVLGGWLLSVSDFLRAHGAVESWETEFGATPRRLVDTLASELPWMGSRSPSRVKAWRLARWVARGECASPPWSGQARASLVVPAPAGERGLKTLGFLPPGWAELAPRERQRWFDGLLLRVAPSEPASAWVPLEAILARGRRGPACQEHLGGCGICPVRWACPSPARA